MNKKTGKYLWCPDCKKYPDKVYSQDWVWTSRKWNGDCYEGYNSESDIDNEKHFCQKCGSNLIDKSIKLVNKKGKEIT